jgi:dTDP-glucose 4,6-dehydratase
LTGGPIRITGDGTPYRSYLYAADLAIWLWTILFRGKSAFPYNVGSPQEVSIADLARSVVATVAPGAAIRTGSPPKPGVIPSRYVPSVSRAELGLGLKVWIPLEESIRRMWQWNSDQRLDAKAVTKYYTAELVGKAGAL